ncbi:hypothetical protein BJ165DRAFT_1526124 [Panaeolus papilionaceus]|nr:hypothetical protein BJ165DRAFT_1526124 [Panaeolus papilionaceus]
MGVFAAGPITRAVAGSLARYDRMLTKGGITRKRSRKAVARVPIDNIPENYLSEFQAPGTTLVNTLPIDGNTPTWDPKAITKPTLRTNDTHTLPDLRAYINPHNGRQQHGCFGANRLLTPTEIRALRQALGHIVEADRDSESSPYDSSAGYFLNSDSIMQSLTMASEI